MLSYIKKDDSLHKNPVLPIYLISVTNQINLIGVAENWNYSHLVLF